MDPRIPFERLHPVLTMAERGTGSTGVFSAHYRLFTLGLLLAVVMAAFEGLAVAAIAPSIARHLGSIEQYSWILTAYLLAQIIGTILASRPVERHGPATPFTVGAVLFGLGLVGCALSPGMALLLIARVVQGFGAGALINVVYASISLVFPDKLRPQAFALIASAYMVPALLGPLLAGLLTDFVSWRLVFVGILPLLLAESLLMAPRLREVGGSGEKSSGTALLLYATLLTAGIAAILMSLSDPALWKTSILLAFGVPLTLFVGRSAFRQGLLPDHPTILAALATRGLLTAAYLAMETLLVLVLTARFDLPASVVGLTVAAGALTWVLGAWLQARWDEQREAKGRERRMLVGAVTVLSAESIVFAVPWSGGAFVGLAIALLGHGAAGFGMGLAEPSTGAVAFAASSTDQSGRTASGIQLADIVMPALAIGVGGALVTWSGTFGLRSVVTVGILLQVLLAGGGVLACLRLHSGDRASVGEGGT